MPFNGSGTFTRVHDWTDDRDAAIPITASRMDSEDDGFATGLSTCITKDGQTTITANLPMAGFKHTGVGNSNARTDYPATGQIQDNSFRFAVGGGSADAQTLTLAPAITAYTDGMVLHFEAGATNTGAATFNVNSVGAQSIVMQNGNALPAGAITSGRFYTVIYDLTNTNWVLVNPTVLTTQSIISPNTTTNAVSIAGDSVTTANVVDISADGLTSGKGLSVTSTSDDTTGRSLVHIDQIGTLATGTICLEVTQGSNNEAVTITSDCTTSNGLICTFNSMTSGSVFDITANGLTTGKILFIKSDSSSTSSRNLVEIVNDNTAATSTTCFKIQQDADASAVFIDHNGNGFCIDINADSITSTSVMIVSADGLTTGKILNLVSNSSSTSTRELVTIHNDNPAATGTSCLELRQDASFRALYIDANGTAAAVDMECAGLCIDIRSTSTSASIIDMTAGSGSYAGNEVSINCARSASVSYSFLVAVSASETTPDTEFDFRGDGNGFADGSFTGGGADFAEYFEWADGNPDGEDRRGIVVQFINGKIAPATSTGNAAGIVSSNPTVVGDGAWNHWQGKYLRDDLGSYITEDHEVWKWEDEYGNEISFYADKITEDMDIPEDKKIIVQQRRKLNPKYDPNMEYESREIRKEWDYVGILGKVRAFKGQPKKASWIKLRDISDQVEEILVR